jgi:hypothetical protein
MPHSEFGRCVVLVGCLLGVACHSRPIQVSNSTTGAYEAALTPFADGFAAAWHDTRDGNGEIYLRLLDASGRPAGPEHRLTNGTEESYEASIERLGDALVVAWYDQSGKGQQTAKLGMWRPDGANLWVHAFPNGTRNPVIRSTATAVFCAWIHTEADGREAVFAGWWHSNGRPRSAPVRLGPASTTTWNLNAAVDESGVGWVAFDAEASTRASEVYLARADIAGPAVRLTSDDGAPSKYPDLSLAAGGRAALSWQEERDGNVEVYLLTGRLSDLGGPIDARARRVTTTPGESVGAYLAWNGDRLGLAWSDRTPGQHDVFFASFDSSGAPRQPARRLTRNATWSVVPAIQPRGDGFALAWNEYAPASVEVHDGRSEVFFTTVP